MNRTTPTAASVVSSGADSDVGNAVSVQIARTRNRSTERVSVRQSWTIGCVRIDFRRLFDRAIRVQEQYVNGAPIGSTCVVVASSNCEVDDTVSVQVTQ